MAAPLMKGAGNDGRERASTVAAGCSVVPNTPNIPNVVEYHLKVKSRSTPTRHRGYDYVSVSKSVILIKRNGKGVSR